MQVAENAGALGLAKVQHHTQNSPVLSTLGVRRPLPAPRFRRSYAVGVPTEEDDKARSRRAVALHATVMATVAEINRHPKRW
jgi:hypothetical protein